MTRASDARVVTSWRYDDEYTLAEERYIISKKEGELSYMKAYEIQEVWEESPELCRSFIEWVKAQDTEQLVAELFRTEESK
jgi:hypothetical protein